MAGNTSDCRQSQVEDLWQYPNAYVFYKTSVPPNTIVSMCKYALARLRRAIKVRCSLHPDVIETSKSVDWCFRHSCCQALLHSWNSPPLEVKSVAVIEPTVCWRISHTQMPSSANWPERRREDPLPTILWWDVGSGLTIRSMRRLAHGDTTEHWSLRVLIFERGGLYEIFHGTIPSIHRSIA